MRKSSNRSSAIALIALSFIVPQAARAAGSQTSTAVSAALGNNTSGCGAATSPCKTFQYALTNSVAPGGTILVLDPGEYGPLSITSPVTIVNTNAGTAGVFSANPTGSTIDINLASGGAVVLDGLTIDGKSTGVGAKGNGVSMKSAGNLIIRNCTISNFVSSGMVNGSGIFIAPTSGTAQFSISGSSFSNNANSGVLIAPNYGSSGSATVSGVLHNVDARGSNYGVYAYADFTSGAVNVTIEDSALVFNATGVRVTGAAGKVTINRIMAQFNTNWDVRGVAGSVLQSKQTNDYEKRLGPVTFTHLQ